MKFKLPIAFVIAIFILSCKNSKEDKNEDKMEMENVDEPIENTAKGKKVTDRDFSVTSENAYNDLKLDSLAMEKYIEQRQIGEKKISIRIRSFYNARNYHYAWFSSKGLTEQARFFWNQYDYAVTHLKDSTLTNTLFYKQAKNYIDREKMTASSNDSLLRNTEFGFTEHFIRYINSTYEKGFVKRKEQEKFIPIKKIDPIIHADSILNKKHKDDKYYEQVNDMYANLKKNLQLYLTITKSGGWQAIPIIKSSLKVNDSNSTIPLIKKRLQMTMDMPGNDSSIIYTDTLMLAIKKFQRRHGYKETGVINSQLIKDMNVTASKRLMGIMVNMDRMRWMPQKPEGNLIIVNLPEFMLHVYKGKELVFDMVVVVGKVGNNTMMFNGDLNQIFFSPYWNVPQSIIKSEILPAIARNPNYLAKKNMEKIGSGIRQKPGPGNSLGKVKFIFPNSFNMYFHDTPSKSLFGLDKRAFSHGCIRLSEPQKMAEWILKDYPEWNTEKIVAAMNQTKEKWVKLKESIPVFIIYYTSWVDDKGELNFRDDVYKHDEELIKKMFVTQEDKLKDVTNVIRVDNIIVSKNN